MNASENSFMYGLELVLSVEIYGIGLLDVFFLVFVLFLYLTECARPSVAVFLLTNPCHSEEISSLNLTKRKNRVPNSERRITAIFCCPATFKQARAQGWVCFSYLATTVLKIFPAKCFRNGRYLLSTGENEGGKNSGQMFVIEQNWFISSQHNFVHHFPLLKNALPGPHWELCP